MKWIAVDQYSGLFFILGFVFLFCSILLFILFRIPGVFLYLSGSRQKKNIQILRRKREEQKKKGFSLQGKIDMEFLRKRSEEKQEEKRRMAEQAPWKQEGEATAKLLMPEDNYRGQETAPLFSSEALSDASSGDFSGVSSGGSAEAGETVKIPLPAESASGAEKNKAKPKSGYVTLYEMESES
ncbi:hypothetical protein [Oribacterium sinus]|uniref:Uncharacterized protein n=1 Tax=Oribacterium sinus F0268 TaxID=585501 RepID=C2KXH5_9FIRM|nr:hypothetical protein [Oribacterium sinus]EEJ51537.1 hypothetical protein HMPREF6123_1194 [Oribacterium sinus F0268]